MEQVITGSRRVGRGVLKSQYTVTEKNSWENETFNYVLMLTSEEAGIIYDKIEKLGEGTLSISKTDYTPREIFRMNNASGNSYMSFIWTYELKEDALNNWKEMGDCFYKGVGLNKLTEKWKHS